jgi:dihydroorotase
MHVHMRGGSQAYKEDWMTGSMSALAGGVTTVVDQPNTVPPLTTADLFTARVREAAQACLCNFGVNAAVTSGADLEGMWKAGALAFGETFAAPSSYGDAVALADLRSLMDRIAALGALMTVHAEEILPGTDDSLAAHDRLRPAFGEQEMVETIGRMRPQDLSLHFCHLSSAASIDAARGSVEVTPHHLFLSRERFGLTDARGKVNPPLRTEQERKNLWSRWDRIDVIASDHAPHTVAEKSGDYSTAPSGIPGVETLMPLLVAEAYRGTITLASLLEKTIFAPARILGIGAPGFRKGCRADFALYPKEASLIRGDLLHSKAGWTPYEGLEAAFPATVIVDGHIALQKGEYAFQRGAWIPGHGYICPGDE